MRGDIEGRDDIIGVRIGRCKSHLLAFEKRFRPSETSLKKDSGRKPLLASRLKP